MGLYLSTSLLVGVKEIDRQHEELFRRQNGLRQAISWDGGQTEVTRAITYLQSYATHHFDTEETWMLRIAYPDYEVHREEHLRFLEAIGGCRDRLIAIRQLPEDLFEMERQLGSWLASHIATADQPLGLFMRKRLTPTPELDGRRPSMVARSSRHYAPDAMDWMSVPSSG